VNDKPVELTVTAFEVGMETDERSMLGGRTHYEGAGGSAEWFQDTPIKKPKTRGLTNRIVRTTDNSKKMNVKKQHENRRKNVLHPPPYEIDR
jgi:hypothetical protein